MTASTDASAIKCTAVKCGATRFGTWKIISREQRDFKGRDRFAFILLLASTLITRHRLGDLLLSVSPLREGSDIRRVPLVCCSVEIIRCVAANRRERSERSEIARVLRPRGNAR